MLSLRSMKEFLPDRMTSSHPTSFPSKKGVNDQLSMLEAFRSGFRLITTVRLKVRCATDVHRNQCLVILIRLPGVHLVYIRVNSWLKAFAFALKLFVLFVLFVEKKAFDLNLCASVVKCLSFFCILFVIRRS